MLNKMSIKQIRELKRMVLSLEDLMEKVRDNGAWCKLSDFKKELEKLIDQYK